MGTPTEEQGGEGQGLDWVAVGCRKAGGPMEAHGGERS